MELLSISHTAGSVLGTIMSFWAVLVPEDDQKVKPLI